jgi:hypothetical protein
MGGGHTYGCSGFFVFGPMSSNFSSDLWAAGFPCKRSRAGADTNQNGSRKNQTTARDVTLKLIPDEGCNFEEFRLLRRIHIQINAIQNVNNQGKDLKCILLN